MLTLLRGQPPPKKKLEFLDRVAGGHALVRARVQALRENANITVATALTLEELSTQVS